MANYKIRQTFQIVDVNGDIASLEVPSVQPDTRTLAQAQSTNALLAAALTACSNGKVTRRGYSVMFDEAQYIVGTAPPTNAEYSSVTDGARLQFSNNLAERYALTVPAPLESVFGASTNIVDSTNANVAALIALIQTAASGASATLFNLYKGGTKVGRGARVRRTSLIP